MINWTKYPSQGPEITRDAAALCAVAAFLVANRFWRAVSARNAGKLQELLPVISLVFLIVLTAISFEACLNGFGMHKDDIQKAGGNAKLALFVSDPSPNQSRMTKLMRVQYFYLFQVFYKMVIWANKLCIF